MSRNFRGAATAVSLSEPTTPEPAREFAFSDADFRSLAQFAYEQAGIALADSKRNLVYSRLSRRLRALGLSSFREYRDYLAGECAPSWKASSTRSRPTSPSSSAKSHHFDHFRTACRRSFRAGGARQSPAAGCASGRPAARPARSPTPSRSCSSAKFATSSRHDVRILATDIDTEVHRQGRPRRISNEFDRRSAEDLPGILPAVRRRGRQPNVSLARTSAVSSPSAASI